MQPAKTRGKDGRKRRKQAPDQNRDARRTHAMWPVSKYKRKPGEKVCQPPHPRVYTKYDNWEKTGKTSVTAIGTDHNTGPSHIHLEPSTSAREKEERRNGGACESTETHKTPPEEKTMAHREKPKTNYNR